MYQEYYQKQLVQQSLEKVLKRNDAVFRTYCDIKPLIENEDISVDYLDDDETLLKKYMRDKLSSDEFIAFEELLSEAGNVAFQEELKFLGSGSMTEHLWVEWGEDKHHKYSR